MKKLKKVKFESLRNDQMAKFTGGGYTGTYASANTFTVTPSGGSDDGPDVID